jgi:purine-binding chemotaxis protein CheW
MTHDTAPGRSAREGRDGATQQFATFLLDDLYFGIEVLSVQEVIRYQDMTRVPLASHVIEGLINLRGQIVTAIDLRRRLGLPDRRDDARPMNVVVRTADGIVSLLVDEIGDVLEVPRADFEQPPHTISDAMRALVAGVYKLDGRLLLVLDVEETAAIESTQRPEWQS